MSARPSRRTTAAAPRSATPAKAVAAVAAPAQAMALYEQVKDHIARKIQEELDRTDKGVFSISRVVIRSVQTDPSIEQSIQQAVANQKKLEAMQDDIRTDVDFVLTYEELMGIFEAKEIKREAENMKAAIRQRADRPTSYLFSRLNPFLFPGGQAYGYDSLGTEANLGKFTAKDVRGFWERQIVQPWVLAVAGDFDREAVLALA